jgi:hypothetical protein
VELVDKLGVFDDVADSGEHPNTVDVASKQEQALETLDDGY